MGKTVTNVKLRVNNYNHAVLILNRLAELNGSESVGDIRCLPEDGTKFIYVDGKGKTYFNRWDFPEKSFDAMEAQEKTLDDLYMLVNMQSMPLKDGDEHIEVYFDEKYVHLAGLNISFKELNQLHDIINKSK